MYYYFIRTLSKYEDCVIKADSLDEAIKKVNNPSFSDWEEMYDGDMDIVKMEVGEGKSEDAARDDVHLLDNSTW